jgi:hypothetical protein
LAEAGNAALPADIAAAFARQAEACLSLGSPFTSELCALVAKNGLPRGAIHDRIAGWEGDATASGDSVPLRLAGTLHHLALSGDDLGELYPPRVSEPSADSVFAALASTFARCEAAILAGLGSPPQTNEVRRSAIIMAGLKAVAAQTGKALELIELGASAGLNLLPDQYSIMLDDHATGHAECAVKLEPEWRGVPWPEALRHCQVTVSARSGCDIAPISLHDETGVRRLRAYVWADQHDRQERLNHAIAVARAIGISVEQANAAEWLANKLSTPVRPHVCRVVYHTVAVQYMPPAEQQAIDAALVEAGRRASNVSPLAHLAFETDGSSPGAPLVLRVWPGGKPHILARADFHGRWLDWHPVA